MGIPNPTSCSILVRIASSTMPRIPPLFIVRCLLKNLPVCLPLTHLGRGFWLRQSLASPEPSMDLSQVRSREDSSVYRPSRLRHVGRCIGGCRIRISHAADFGMAIRSWGSSRGRPDRFADLSLGPLRRLEHLTIVWRQPFHARRFSTSHPKADRGKHQGRSCSCMGRRKGSLRTVNPTQALVGVLLMMHQTDVPSHDFPSSSCSVEDLYCLLPRISRSGSEIAASRAGSPRRDIPCALGHFLLISVT
jgi:hypothetical protein